MLCSAFAVPIALLVLETVGAALTAPQGFVRCVVHVCSCHSIAHVSGTIQARGVRVEC